MNKIQYKNRYNDVFIFNKTEDGNILMEGDFEFVRIGYPNVYDDAYEAYKKDTDEDKQISLKEFIKNIHSAVYDENDNYICKSEIGEKYDKLVYSNTDVYNMIDPSGGPYLSEGQDMGIFDASFKGMKIEQFKSVNDGFLIIIKK